MSRLIQVVVVLAFVAIASDSAFAQTSFCPWFLIDDLPDYDVFYGDTGATSCATRVGEEAYDSLPNGSEYPGHCESAETRALCVPELTLPAKARLDSYNLRAPLPPSYHPNPDPASENLPLGQRKVKLGKVDNQHEFRFGRFDVTTGSVTKTHTVKLYKVVIEEHYRILSPTIPPKKVNGMTIRLGVAVTHVPQSALSDQWGNRPNHQLVLQGTNPQSSTKFPDAYDVTFLGETFVCRVVK